MVPAGRMEQTSPSASGPVLRFLRPALMLAFLVAGAVLLRAVPGLRHVLDSTALLRDGVWGRMVFLAGASVWCAFGLPRQVAGFAAGLAYGAIEGTVMITLPPQRGVLPGFSGRAGAGGSGRRPGWGRVLPG